jgi:hypothetical protein
MTREVDRRKILTTAALGAAGLVGATALGSLAPEAAFGATATPQVLPGGIDPNFAEGRVTGIDGTLIRANGSDGRLHRIQATVATSVWKLFPTTFDAVLPGDGLYARGLRLPDGTLAADSIWVNIVSLDAHVATVRRDAVHLDHRGSPVVGHVVPGRSAAVYNGTPAISDMSMVQIGRHVHVIGAWHPDTNEIDIATLYTAV